VLALGLLVLLARLATPLIGEFRDEIARYASLAVGQPVTLGDVQARWYGLRPLIELRDVRVGQGEDAVRVARVALDLTPGRLMHREDLLRGARIIIEGMRLTAVREPSGEIHLEGIGLLGAQRDDGETPRLALPSRLSLVGTRIVWIDRRAGKAPLTLDNVAVALAQQAGRFRLRASLESPAGSASLALDSDRPPLTTDWNGDSYLRVENLDVAGLFAPYLPSRYGLRTLRLDLESWSQWRGARQVEDRGTFAVREMRLRPKAPHGPFALDGASGRYQLRRDRERLRIDVNDLSLAFGDRRWRAAAAAILVDRSSPAAPVFEFRADYLGLGDLARLLAVRTPSDDWHEPLRRIEPDGQLRDLRLRVAAGSEGTDWRASARFSGVKLKPYDNVPGVHNLSGTLLAETGHARLRLDSRNTTLVFNGLFRQPLELTRLQGDIDLLDTDGGWQLRSDALTADSRDIVTRSRLFLSQQPGEDLFVDLQTEFRDGDAAQASRYYPVGIMGDGLVRWLDRSILSGRVRQGTALVYGRAKDFAFEHARSGMFQVIFDAEDVRLAYRDGWPALESLSARVRFEGNHLEIVSRSGRLFDSRIEGVSARIASLEPAAPLHIRGRVVGPLGDQLRLLQEPALRDRFGTFAAAVRGEGEATLELDLEVPLASDDDNYRLDGRLQLRGNRLTLPQRDLAISDITGVLRFDLDGLSADDIHAVALGAPLSIDVGPGPDGATRVATSGRLAVADLQQRWPFLPQGLASGAAAFDVDIDIPAASRRNAATWLQVASSLQGIALDLPEPFGKPAALQRRVTARVPLDAPRELGSLAYGDVLGARFTGDGERVAIRVGGVDVTPPSVDGIRIDGALDRLDPADWAQRLGQGLDGSQSPALPPVEAALTVDSLEVAGQVFTGVAASASHADGAWRGRIESSALAGIFEWPADVTAVPARVDLQRLHLRQPEADRQAAPGDPAPAGVDPSALPGLSLQVSDLRLDDAALGALALAVVRDSDGLEITSLQLDGAHATLEAAGSWRGDGSDGATRLGGSLRTDDIGELLVDLGYARQFEEAGGRVDFLLRWPGAPWQAELAALTGKISLATGSGRLPELDPGAARVVGLLNLNAIARRLRLDFRDIFRKGFAFDRIGGDFVFADARATTENLAVTGPSGRILLSGDADLDAATLDQQVTVIPNLTATLPIAGTLAGGPVAGVAVLLAQEVLADEVDNINRFEYHLGGPWSAPEIVQLDSGGALSKLMWPLSDAARGDSEAGAPALQSLPNAVPQAPEDGRSAASADADGAAPTQSGDTPAPSLKRTLDELWQRIRQPDGEDYDPLNPAE
jgi:uncharacterized protein (TIGR02099 family)